MSGARFPRFPTASGGVYTDDRTSGAMIYVVQSGDTLAEIAGRHGTTVSRLVGANPQITNPSRIFVGQRITVPSAAPAPAPRPQPGPDEQSKPQPAPDDKPADQAPGRKPDQGGAWTLPERGEARKLIASDFDAAARELGVETAAVRAVAEVEAGGRSGFDAASRPKILFEIHKFRKHTGSKYDTSHPHLSAPYKSKLRRASYRKDQWEVIREAFALDAEAALKSASWGMFQVMGENYKMCGWSSVKQFVTDMFLSEAQHMRAFLGFCRGAGLVRHIKAKSWAAFARGYNGPDYASNAYDTKMANAYKRYSAAAPKKT